TLSPPGVRVFCCGGGLIRGARAGAPRRGGTVMTVASFDVDGDGLITRIWAVRNPEKLRPWLRDG
ncbi:hypothetical protein ACFW9R_13520, partial [Streptomyces microflavus]